MSSTAAPETTPDVRSLAALLHETIASNKLSASRVERVRAAVLPLYAHPSQLEECLMHAHRQATSSTSVSSLYLVDAVCGQARSLVKRKRESAESSKEGASAEAAADGSGKAGAGDAQRFLDRMDGRVEEVALRTLKIVKPEQREKVFKIVDIWHKSGTFKSATLRAVRTRAKIEETKLVERESARAEQRADARRASQLDESTPGKAEKVDAPPSGLPSHLRALLDGGSASASPVRSEASDERERADSPGALALMSAEVPAPQKPDTSSAVPATAAASADQTAGVGLNAALALIQQLSSSGLLPSQQPPAGSAKAGAATSTGSHVAAGPAPGSAPQTSVAVGTQPPQYARAVAGPPPPGSVSTQMQARPPPPPPTAFWSAQAAPPSVKRAAEEGADAESSKRSRPAPAGVQPDPSVGDMSTWNMATFFPTPEALTELAQRWYNSFQQMPTQPEMFAWLAQMNMQLQMQMQMQAQAASQAQMGGSWGAGWGAASPPAQMPPSQWQPDGAGAPGGWQESPPPQQAQHQQAPAWSPPPPGP